MNVLWFNHRDPKHPQAGGAEVRILAIGKRLVYKGCSVKLVCERWAGSKSKDVLDGIEIFRVADRFGVHLKIPSLLNRFDDYDVVIDDIAHAVPWFSPLFTRKPVLAQVHHLHQDVLNVELPPFEARLTALSERTLPFLYKNIIAVSESTKHDLINKFGISRERIKIVPNGVEVPVKTPMVKHSEPTILWIGRVKRYKRVEHVLLAFKLVKKNLSNARLFIVGSGDHLDSIKQISERLGLSDVVFTGWVSEPEKIRLMSSAWVIVSTSLIEGWGLSVLEGAACATPAVTYDVGGLRDCVRNGVTGFLVKNGNAPALAEALIMVLTNEGLRRKLSMNAFEYAKNFSWDRSTESFIKILTQAVVR